MGRLFGHLDHLDHFRNSACVSRLSLRSYDYARTKYFKKIFFFYILLMNKLNLIQTLYTAQKIKFSIKGFFSKCDQKLQIWSHLLKKSLMENFIFCAVVALVVTIYFAMHS